MTETSTALVLSDKEAALIREILEERYNKFLLEIAHTDHHDFKDVLREKAGLVESVLSRLVRAGSAAAESASSKNERVDVRLSA